MFYVKLQKFNKEDLLAVSKQRRNKGTPSLGRKGKNSATRRWVYLLTSCCVNNEGVGTSSLHLPLVVMALAAAGAAVVAILLLFVGVGSCRCLLSFSSIGIGSCTGCHRHRRSPRILIRVTGCSVVAVVVIILWSISSCSCSCHHGGWMYPWSSQKQTLRWPVRWFLLHIGMSYKDTKRKIKDNWAYQVCPLPIPPSFSHCFCCGTYGVVYGTVCDVATM